MAAQNKHTAVKEMKTRNQYASPPPGNAIPAGPIELF